MPHKSNIDDKAYELYRKMLGAQNMEEKVDLFVDSFSSILYPNEHPNAAELQMKAAFKQMLKEEMMKNTSKVKEGVEVASEERPQR